MSMESLRTGAQSLNQNGKKGATRASYYARWKPPTMVDPLKRFLAAPPSEESYLGISEPIVIIAGQYPDLLARNPDGSVPNPPPMGEAYHFRAHTFAIHVQGKNGKQGFRTFREVVCSAGPEPHAPQPCIGCYQVDHGADAKARDTWAFNIAHLGYYHNQPLVKDGQIQLKKNSNDPVMVKNECLAYKMENILQGRAAQARVQGIKQPRRCEGCDGNHPFLFGDHRVLQVGRRHLDNLFEIDDKIGNRCMNCNTYMLRTEFRCGNEHCDTLIFQIAQSGWTNAQIDQFSKSQYGCPACQTLNLPYSIYECGYSEQYVPIPGAGCPQGVDPRKMSIFDCVLWIQREGEKMESEIVVKKFEPITDYRTHDGRSLGEHLPEIVRQPYDLLDMYSPDSLDDQAKTIGIQNPYAAQQPAYTAYGSAPPMQGMPPVMPQQQPQYGQQSYMQAPPFPGQPMPGRPNFGK